MVGGSESHNNTVTLTETEIAHIGLRTKSSAAKHDHRVCASLPFAFL